MGGRWRGGVKRGTFGFPCAKNRGWNLQFWDDPNQLCVGKSWLQGYELCFMESSQRLVIYSVGSNKGGNWYFGLTARIWIKNVVWELYFRYDVCIICILQLIHVCAISCKYEVTGAETLRNNVIMIQFSGTLIVDDHSPAFLRSSAHLMIFCAFCHGSQINVHCWYFCRVADICEFPPDFVVCHQTWPNSSNPTIEFRIVP